MPKGEDINVVIGDMTAKKSDVDGAKLGPLPDVMTDAMTKFFKKQSGYVVKKASDKPKSGFKISGNIKSLTKETRDGVELVTCWVSLVLAELPKDSMVPGKLEGFGGTDIRKDLQKDIEFAVATATTEAATMAIKQIKHALK